MDSFFQIATYIVISFLINHIWRQGRVQRGEEEKGALAPVSPVPSAAAYWDVLEIEPTSDLQEIKRGYRALIKKYHPDIAGHHYNLKCAEITEAYRQAINT